MRALLQGTCRPKARGVSLRSVVDSTSSSVAGYLPNRSSLLSRVVRATRTKLKRPVYPNESHMWNLRTDITRTHLPFTHACVPFNRTERKWDSDIQQRPIVTSRKAPSHFTTEEFRCTPSSKNSSKRMLALRSPDATILANTGPTPKPSDCERGPITGHLENSPKLIVDAKALYDILVKEEIQAATGSDKRTTIEALVCRDKLACCNGKVMWVSSELQYADGLTKDSAAPLLGQRLRSHMTKLKSDETFQASKKKSVASRRKGESMYAIKRPERAMYTMFSTYFLNTVNAHVYQEGDHRPQSRNYETEEYDVFDFAMMILFTMLIGIFMWFGVRFKDYITTSRTRPTTRECGVQTTRTGLEEQRLVELRKEKIKLTDEVTHLRDEWALAQSLKK